MAKLSKTQLSNIVDDVVQEWGEEATIRNLSLQKITILRAYLNLYDALLSLPKNKDRDVKEKLHDKIDEIKPILGHLLDASISYCSIKTKTIKEKYINLNYTYVIFGKEKIYSEHSSSLFKNMEKSFNKIISLFLIGFYLFKAEQVRSFVPYYYFPTIKNLQN